MDNEKENGNYKDYRDYIGVIGYILGLYRDNGKKMDTTIMGHIGLRVVYAYLQAYKTL